MRVLVTLLTITCTASPLCAAEYHVSTTGADANPGSQDSPFRTIQHAAELAQPGDVITVHEGVYRERDALVDGDFEADLTLDEKPDGLVADRRCRSLVGVQTEAVHCHDGVAGQGKGPRRFFRAARRNAVPARSRLFREEAELREPRARTVPSHERRACFLEGPAKGLTRHRPGGRRLGCFWPSGAERVMPGLRRLVAGPAPRAGPEARGGRTTCALRCVSWRRTCGRSTKRRVGLCRGKRVRHRCPT